MIRDDVLIVHVLGYALDSAAAAVSMEIVALEMDK